MSNILKKIKKAELIGRGGAGFPTAVKWRAVKKTKSKKKYVICNAAEGEPGLFKDFYILENFPEKVFKGLQLAMDFLKTKDCYFNFNPEYYQQLNPRIQCLIKKYQDQGYRFTIQKAEPRYIAGEETALLNAIEGQRLEPRFKPPFPTEKGLFDCPTLVHNVETLFNIALVAENKFQSKRFYSVSGQVKCSGVYFLPDSWSVRQILKATKNRPNFDFFVQIGGGAAGEVLNQNQARTERVRGAGAIEVYSIKTTPKDLLLKWLSFYSEESCGKCAPCRLASFNLYQILKENKPRTLTAGLLPGGKDKVLPFPAARPQDISKVRGKDINWPAILSLLETTEKTSFCPLGKSISVPIRSYLKNVLKLPSE